MCLRIENSKNWNWFFKQFPRLKAKRAKKDIKVIKILEYDSEYEVFETPFRNAVLPFNEELKSKFTYHECVSVDIHEGLHSFSNPLIASVLWFLNTSNYHYFEAIIPKGALYFIGDRYDVVSNKLIITGKELNLGEVTAFKFNS